MLHERGPGAFRVLGEAKERKLVTRHHAGVRKGIEGHDLAPIGLVDEQDRKLGLLAGLANVNSSNSSSRVPKPPGNTTSAFARMAKCILRIAK